jgi:hypothetical protein
MKARPRNVENEIAKILSEKFVSIGLDPVERIPVTGRTGPDITFNELALIVDVKSRLEIPKGFIVTKVTTFGNDLIGVPVSEMESLLVAIPEAGPTSKIVSAYYAHMKEWTDAKCRRGITAIVLHKPKLAYAKSVLIISVSQMEEFAKRWNQTAPQSLLFSPARTPLLLPS